MKKYRITWLHGSDWSIHNMYYESYLHLEAVTKELLRDGFMLKEHVCIMPTAIYLVEEIIKRD